MAPENKPGPKRKVIFQRHQFPGVSFREGQNCLFEGPWFAQVGLNNTVNRVGPRPGLLPYLGAAAPGQVMVQNQVIAC